MKPEYLDILKVQEEQLQFKKFGSTEALTLGNAVAELAWEYDRGISVAIVREQDDMILFSYSMDDKKKRNLDFMQAKRRAAKLSGHCSLWPYVEHELTGRWQEIIDQVPEILPVGGAFPIRAENNWVATLMISGLHEGKDHELAVRSLSSVLGVEVPEFPGIAV